MASSILYRDRQLKIILIDIPRSIEVAQGDPTSTRRIISSKPFEHPYPSLEPKSSKAKAKLPEVELDDLLRERRLELSLYQVKRACKAKWCLDRVVREEPEDTEKHERGKKRNISEQAEESIESDGEGGIESSVVQLVESSPENALVTEMANEMMSMTSDEDKNSIRATMQQELNPALLQRCQAQGYDPILAYFRRQALRRLRQQNQAQMSQPQQLAIGQRPQNTSPTAPAMQPQRSVNPDPLLAAGIIRFFYHNPSPAAKTIQADPFPGTVTIPPFSTLLGGDITATLKTFTSKAPSFDLVILDPPWPNRSARRSKSYDIPYNTSSIKRLLFSIPLEGHLNEGGMVGVWVTNKDEFRNMVTGKGELFDKWGVKLVEEWIWLKVTSQGEPICALDSTWRKPWEILLVGRKIAGNGPSVANTRVLVGVPDLHSRKPNLREIFAQITSGRTGQCLEVFARNLTAGWWSWGNEVLKFQMDGCWVDSLTPTKQ